MREGSSCARSASLFILTFPFHSGFLAYVAGLSIWFAIGVGDREKKCSYQQEQFRKYKQETE